MGNPPDNINVTPNWYVVGTPNSYVVGTSNSSVVGYSFEIPYHSNSYAQPQHVYFKVWGVGGDGGGKIFQNYPCYSFSYNCSAWGAVFQLTKKFVTLNVKPEWGSYSVDAVFCRLWKPDENE